MPLTMPSDRQKLTLTEVTPSTAANAPQQRSRKPAQRIPKMDNRISSEDLFCTH